MTFLPPAIFEQKVYTGFWSRFAARLTDSLVFMPIILALHALSRQSIATALLAEVAAVLLYVFYIVYGHYRLGGTIGKWLFDIRVTRPDGSRITLKQSLVRASVEILLLAYLTLGEMLAIRRTEPGHYLSTSFFDQAEYLSPFLPMWYDEVLLAAGIWYFTALFVLLFNKRKRALHDYMAGTVVIQKTFAD